MSVIVCQCAQCKTLSMYTISNADDCACTDAAISNSVQVATRYLITTCKVNTHAYNRYTQRQNIQVLQLPHGLKRQRLYCRNVVEMQITID